MIADRRLLALAVLGSLAASGALPRSADAQAQPAAAQEQPRKAHRPPVPGVHGLVTTGGQPLAAMAGARILMAGGNAIDAAVAVLSTLNVVEPEMSGAGGNGFMTFFEKKTGRVYSLGMTGAAPKALVPADMTPQKLVEGIQAGIVPGLFGGWIAMLDRFGTRSLAEVLAPAIDYAGNGHPIDPLVVRSITGRKEFFKQFPTSARIFLPNGEPPLPGELFRNTDLAGTFNKVVEAEKNALAQGRDRSAALRAAFDRFYKGDIAQEFVRFYKENGGLFTLEDFAAYEPIWQQPVHTTYRGYDVYSNPSTTRGGLEVLMQLNLIEGFDVASLGQNSAEALHLIMESIKVAKSDVYRYVADPRFTDIPLAGLLSKDYAAARRKLIDPRKAGLFPDPGRPAGVTTDDGAAAAPPAGPRFDEKVEDGHTTSFSVVDQAGNAVVITPTLGSGFGTGVIVGGTGLFFNNGTRLGSTSPYPDNVNYVAPGKIPLLNNSPIVVLKDGKLLLALGSPGGETIGQTQFQALLNVLDFRMPIQEAIEAPRFALVADPNFYKPGAAVTARMENRVPEAVVRALESMGHRIELTSGYTTGNMQGIYVNPKTGTMTAGADSRRSGYAVGW